MASYLQTSNCFAHLTEKVPRNKRPPALIFQSTSVTKPAMNGLPFAADGTEIEKVWPFGRPGGGSPSAGRCAGLGTGRRMMLGSITTSLN